MSEEMPSASAGRFHDLPKGISVNALLRIVVDIYSRIHHVTDLTLNF